MSNNITDSNGTTPMVFKKIDPSDLKFNPVQVNKTFSFYSGSYNSSTSNHLPLRATHWAFPDLPYGTFDSSSNAVLNDPRIESNVDGSWTFNIYNSIYHLFYKNKTEPSKTLGLVNLNKASRFLYQSASIISIPQPKFGLRIKPTSFVYSGSSGVSMIYGSGKWGSGVYG